MMLLTAMMLQAAAPQWQLRSTVDPITDRRDATAQITQDSNQIAVGCSAESSGIAGIAIGMPRYLASSGTAGMSFRFDGGPAERILVVYMGRKVEIARRADAARFAGMLMSGRSLVVQIGDSAGMLHNATFDLPADSAAIGTAIATCLPFGDME